MALVNYDFKIYVFFISVHLIAFRLFLYEIIIVISKKTEKVKS